MKSKHVDLFGWEQRKRKSRLEQLLAKYDRDSFEERLGRLKFLSQIFPKNTYYMGSFEGAFLLEEAKNTFINGQYVATMMLSQAFIERLLADFFKSKGRKKITTCGLHDMVEYAREHELINEYFLKRIDILRLKRNPFTHRKPFNHRFNISKRVLVSLSAPMELLEKDAKAAILLLYEFATARLS